MLGCDPCRQFRGLPFSLFGGCGRTGCLLGQFGFMRPFRGFPLGGASGSFGKHGFSCRPTLYDRRIVGAGAGTVTIEAGTVVILSGSIDANADGAIVLTGGTVDVNP